MTTSPSNGPPGPPEDGSGSDSESASGREAQPDPAPGREAQPGLASGPEARPGDRPDERARRRMPRGARPTTSLLVALLAMAVCAFVAVEAVWVAVDRQTVMVDVHAVSRWARQNEWDAPAVWAFGCVVGAVGIAILLAGVLPARRRVVECDAGDPAAVIGLPPRAFRRAMTAAALTVDGVTSARVDGVRTVRITAATPLHHTDGLTDAIRAAVDGQLTALSPRRAPTVHVRLRRERS